MVFDRSSSLEAFAGFVVHGPESGVQGCAFVVDGLGF